MWLRSTTMRSRNQLFLSKKSFCTRRSRKKKTFSDIVDHRLTGTEEGSAKKYEKSLIKFTRNIIREFQLDFCQTFFNLNQTSKACLYYAFSISSKAAGCFLLAFLAEGSQLIVRNAASVILIGNSFNCSLMFSFIHNSSSIQQWKDIIREKTAQIIWFCASN